jgi:toxin FitB
MSGYLVDTNVISEPSRKRPNRGVTAWFAAAEESTLYMSVITLGEVRRGIEKVVDGTKKAALERFFVALRSRFAQRILPVDEEVAERWGRLTGRLSDKGIHLPAIDALIAATALAHDLTVVTRNAQDFHNAAVTVIDPFVSV